VRADVAFTPAETISAPVGIVVDVLRATSTIAQALAVGYERVYCCREIDDALALRKELGSGLLGGERSAVKIDGFDVGASPREFLEGGDEPVIFSTTNGTRAILAAAGRCDEVYLGSLLNLSAVARAAGERGEDVAVLCAGFQGAFALDDAYCAGRIVQLLDAERGDAAKASVAIAGAWPDSHEALLARTYGPPGLELDIAYCAQVDLLDVVPRFERMHGRAAEITNWRGT
jgi:2-phosphosulfolactate phosphatase